MPVTDGIRVLYSADVIARAVERLAQCIAASGLDRLLAVAILKGSIVFSADLLRALHKAGVELEVDFLSLSSYRTGQTSTGIVSLVRDVEGDVRNRNVLLIDDILESGRTLLFARDLMQGRGARCVATCVLLNKQAGRAVPIEADFAAFDCPDVFVVGYGMDLAHRFRELPFIGEVVDVQT